MKIYVASSWRNELQPRVVYHLRDLSHEVYDFKNPPGGTGFSWSSIDPNWENWTAREYAAALDHPLAVAGHASDISALDACEACVLVLPSGRSASWEFGYAMAKGKIASVLQLDGAGQVAPELMYRGATILASWEEFLDYFRVNP